MQNDFLSLFCQSVKQYPDKIALQFFSENLTYKKLDKLSNQIAANLINHNIKPNSPVILEVEKSLIYIIYILGIIKAGCYYIPIASNIPVNRLSYLLENSRCEVAFLYNHYSEFKSNKNLNCFLIEKNLSKLIDNTDNRSTEFTYLSPQPYDPICCLYTSGSTGYPKGVLMSQIGFATFFEDIKSVMNMNYNSICLNTAPFIFDVSIIDTFLPLTLGATVYIVPEIILPNFILKLIDQHQITHMSGVSSTINLLFGNSELLNKYNVSSLITVMTGAELLHQKTLYTLLKQSPSTTIINGYGLTETTCVATAFIINIDNVKNYLLYPIGKPLSGLTAKILFTDSAEGERGELLLSGDQIMLGYLNNPDANKYVFVDYEGKRYLKTGDIVSYDKDYNFIFHGRNDTQVKINGYRVDLNEIKYTMLSMENVNEAEIIMLESSIVAVLSSKIKLEDSEKEKMIDNAKKILNNSLPKYMHPKNWIILDALPKLSTGKTDLKKLYNFFTLIN